MIINGIRKNQAQRNNIETTYLPEGLEYTSSKEKNGLIIVPKCVDEIADLFVLE